MEQAPPAQAGTWFGAKHSRQLFSVPRPWPSRQKFCFPGCSSHERVSAEDLDRPEPERCHGLRQAGHLRLALQQGRHLAAGIFNSLFIIKSITN